MVLHLVGIGHLDELGRCRTPPEPALERRIAGGFAQIYGSFNELCGLADKFRANRIEIGDDQRLQFEEFEQGLEEIGISAADLEQRYVLRANFLSAALLGALIVELA